MHVMRLLQNSSCNIFHWKIKIGFLVRILSPSFYNGTYEYPPVYWLFSFSFLHVKMTIRSWIDVSFFSQWILISSIFVSHTYIHIQSRVIIIWEFSSLFPFHHHQHQQLLREWSICGRHVTIEFCYSKCSIEKVNWFSIDNIAAYSPEW